MSIAFDIFYRLSSYLQEYINDLLWNVFRNIIGSYVSNNLAMVVY
jgi:hypothetical protein